MSNGAFSYFAMLVVIVLVLTPFALGANLLTEKLGENRWVWTILTLIPGLNVIFGFYVAFHLVCHVVDSLKAMRVAIGAMPEAAPPSDPA